MLYLAWSAVFIAMAAFLALAFRQRIEWCVAPAIQISILALYLCGLAGFLKTGVYLCAGLVLLSAGGCVALCLGRKSTEKGLWLTPGLLIFLLMVVYIAWAQGGRAVLGNDEFSHWAYTVKMMVRYDSLSVFHSGEMSYPTYPPASSLLEYLLVRFTPAFSESYLYRGMNLLQVSCLLPFLARFEWKRLPGALLGMGTLYLLPLAIYGEFYTDLCVDGTLALLFAYALFIWFGRRKRDLFTFLCLGLAGSTLILYKESGLLFALWGLIVIVWDSLHRGGLQLKKQPLKKQLYVQRGWLAVLAVMLVTKFSWNITLSVCGLNESSGGVFKNLRALAGPWDDRTAVTVRAFLRKLFMYPELDAPVRLSVVLWLAVGAVLIGLAAAQSPEKRSGLRRLRRGLVAGFAVYALGLLYLYLFSFGEYEGTRVFSFWRYLGSWLLAPALLGVGFLLEHSARSENSEMPVMLLAGSLLIFPFNTLQVNNLVSPKTEIVQGQAQRAAYPSAQRFPLLSEQDRVYFVADDTAVYEKLCAAYSLYPIVCDSSVGYNFDPAGEQAMYASEVTAEEWAQALQQDEYTYVYLYSVSDGFAARYGGLFEDAAVPGAMYAVNRTGNSVRLVRVDG